jgi:hypothetical protein
LPGNLPSNTLFQIGIRKTPLVGLRLVMTGNTEYDEGREHFFRSCEVLERRDAAFSQGEML